MQKTHGENVGFAYIVQGPLNINTLNHRSLTAERGYPSYGVAVNNYGSWDIITSGQMNLEQLKDYVSSKKFKEKIPSCVMIGLCHVCFTSNSEVEVENGEAICVKCKQKG